MSLLSSHVPAMLQYAAQLGGRGLAHLARDSGGNMIRAREDPDIAGDSLQKLNLHQRTAAGDEVARRDHQIARGNRREELGAERIARARRQNQIGGAVFTLRRDQLPVSAAVPAIRVTRSCAHFHTPARRARSSSNPFSARREKIATGCCMWKRTRCPDGLINSQCATGLLALRLPPETDTAAKLCA